MAIWKDWDRSEGEATAVGLIVGLLCIGIPFMAIHSMIISTAARLVGVEPPAFFEGMGISFVLTLANFLASLAAAFGIGLVTGSATASGMVSQEDMQAMGPAFAVALLLIGPLVSAGVFSVMLQGCSYGRGLLVWLAQFIVVALFLVLIYLVVLVLGLSSKVPATR
jgi:hypothetical protein